MIGRMAPADRVALVTGSSHGLGRVIARRLARDGLAVAVNGLDAEAARGVADAIRDDGGPPTPSPPTPPPPASPTRRRSPGRSAYVTARSAQIGLTRGWARELAPLGITVNTVAPAGGWSSTAAAGSADGRRPRWASYAWRDRPVVWPTSIRWPSGSRM
jgi:NAD(P)-dependent dehydrogenase (short-subunit alcohol dehydrogenase family)